MARPYAIARILRVSGNALGLQYGRTSLGVSVKVSMGSCPVSRDPICTTVRTT